MADPFQFCINYLIEKKKKKIKKKIGFGQKHQNFSSATFPFFPSGKWDLFFSLFFGYPSLPRPVCVCVTVGVESV